LVVLREPKIYHDLADFTRIVDFTWRVSDCEELVGEVNHTTGCVTDLFWIVDFEWTIL